MPTNKEQMESFLADHPDVELFEVMVPDLNGSLRGKWVTRDKIAKLLSGEVKLPLSTLAFDVWGRDPHELVFETGDGDGICRSDARTVAIVPWSSRPTAQVLASLNELTGEACAYDGRMALAEITDRLAKHGLTPVVASEMEFYLFAGEAGADGVPQHTQQENNVEGGQTYSIDTMQDMAEFMHSVRDACEIQNVPIDTLIKEAAPSQYEINLYHQNDALLAADQSIMLRRIIKSVAKQQGMRASFMAKPFAELAGNGMHMHCSLVDAEGNNAFNNDTDEGNELLRHAIAGCLAIMSDSMLLFAPHLNSYRRFQRGSHAPLAPSWGYENRTVSIRVPADVHQAMRIEHRVAGADANPYLVKAAILAGMLYGIENKLAAPEPVSGNAYEECEPSLPRYWPDALARFKQSDFIKEYFGEEFQRVFALVKQQELDAFDQQITPLEYQSDC